ncbi:PEP-CTERM sorting domain-containing protein [Noviherbaspirillum pedocola]|uniref:PEP-CTERM sorting domain-containing protein n=1 Tax=Noviherbaspirillum pedocola TaxID=2801341 RepID=A0A934T104_9BURK|nr:PEP-CTERM sorting domain-containing protein [Noviherbaspirillum pedocola]MBK4735443.1 PEP-CTERM sorting domain-containing protein [Noviherbaspirillum pedocola]
MDKTSFIRKGLIGLGLTIAAASSHAALILDTPSTANLSGTGIGNVNTILTIQSPGSTTTETGSVGWNGTATTTSGNVISGGNGTSQNQAVTFASAGFTSAANLASDLSALRLVFNAQEPGNTAENGINLSNLVLSFFSPTGATLFTSGAFNAQANGNFPTTQTGVGNSGFVFKLDGADITAATTALSGANFSLNDRIGLTASALNATGGPDTFFTVRFQNGATGGGGGGAGIPVPEPATLAMLGLGIGALGFARRRKS